MSGPNPIIKNTASRRLRRLTRLRWRPRPWILGATLVLIVVQIVALSPSSVDENLSASGAIDPEALAEQEESVFLSDTVPKGKVPDYTMEKFEYVSAKGNVREWKVLAERAFMYQSPGHPDDKLVHARVVTANLYDPDGKITVITGNEAKYFLKQKDLEVFGAVKARLPDGFEIRSEYMRFRPDSRRIEIPVKYRVNGDGTEQVKPKSGETDAAPGAKAETRRIRFGSDGMEFAMAESLILLPQSVHMTVDTPPPAKSAKREGAPREVTVVDSDRCLVDRAKQIAHYTMSPERPLDQRFVHITQPRLFARARRADMNYGAADQFLSYITAFDDVLVKEMGNQGGELRYGTGGRADFDSRRNLIILRQFPQVYENNDTVTGDVITLHRDTDVVEVENSNAFSQGSSGTH